MATSCLGQRTSPQWLCRAENGDCSDVHDPRCVQAFMQTSSWGWTGTRSPRKPHLGRAARGCDRGRGHWTPSGRSASRARRRRSWPGRRCCVQWWRWWQLAGTPRRRAWRRSCCAASRRPVAPPAPPSGLQPRSHVQALHLIGNFCSCALAVELRLQRTCMLRSEPQGAQRLSPSADELRPRAFSFPAQAPAALRR